MSTFATLSSSQRMDWATDGATFHDLHEEFRFTIDVCASPGTACLVRHFTETEDGLWRSWAGERVYMNPPYGRQLPRWITKAWTESAHAELIVGLIPARTDTAYWHEFIFGWADVRFLRGRLRFEGARNVCPFPVAVVVWSPALRPDKSDGSR